MKQYSRHKNKVNENKILSHCEALGYMRNMIIMSNLETRYHFKINFPNVEQRKRQLVNPRQQTPSGQSVVKFVTPL